jgi:16S rRNA (uracil1498-N3)-methyltransferase
LTDRKLARLRRIVLEAAKQSGRRRVPVVEPVPTLPQAVGGDTLALLLDPAPGGTPLYRICERVERPPRTVWLAVGPEGGFDDEVAPAGWQPALLGPRTLRSETAGLVAASIVLHLWGDLGPAG